MKEQVRTYPHIKQKYIIVRSLRSGEELVLLWGNPDAKWHNDILKEITAAGIEVLEVLGGGWLYTDPEKAEIYVWGASDRFGSAPNHFIRQLLGDTVLEQEPR